MPLPLELENSNMHVGAAMAGEFVGAAAAAGSGDAAAASRHVAQLLFWVGFTTMLLDLFTVFYKAPGGVVFKSHKLAYYLTLAAIFACGMAEIIAAFCLCRYGSSERVRTSARAVVFVSVLPLVGVIALGGFAFVKS